MKKLAPRQNLIKSRKDRGMTQDDLAAMANLSRAMLSNIERGYTLPSLPTAYRIAKVLKRSIEYLFFEDNAQKMSEDKSA
ncbi:helix-turn-helix transcriptional regulator [Brevibacillus agri]|uniref:Helix-turn-helix transcriptional regulator n=1 Tax=Brevibacillus thermoruber TaxID=33942 RepID=A0A9X3Z478_9BACL|nr:MULTISPECIES: helix-turn-helix transcriptional regulator [Brevibacillus]MCG5251591.1 helix-turn-helix domain-containing protein [Brevibacillus agri]MDA5109325.1 helix-turn-helix transcriptional regulator [Brevibacillus thermoruber]MED4572622.1 helix-turn-helix transcriptional regulator [Brevibacillus agri]